MYFALLRAGGSAQGLANGWCRRLPLLLLALWLSPPPLRAETVTPGEGERALPAVIHVGVPVPLKAPIVVAAGAGYGWMDEAGGLEGGHRLRSQVGGAFSLTPNLAVALDARGRWDSYSSDTASKLYGEPRLTLRAFDDGPEPVHLGAELDVRLIGAEAPSVELAATTPTLRGLLAARLSATSWLGATLGFSLDRSSEAVPNATVLSAADKRTLDASKANSLEWGVGVSHRLRPNGTELLGELSGELLVGSDAPNALESPSRLSVGARHPLGHAWSVLASADLALSARPDPLQAAMLLPIEPRFGAGIAFIWRILAEQPVAPTPPAPPPTVTQAPEPPPAPVVAQPEPPAVDPIRGNVVDEGGRPLADVQVTLQHPTAGPSETWTFADGSFEFRDVPDGTLTLSATTPGFDTATVRVDPSREQRTEIVLRPSVPAGQVRGKVFDLRGKPVTATITVTPGNQVVPVGADGSFELELAPGEYTVKFEQTGFAPQQRRIHVADRGVVILNIPLAR